MNRQGPDHTASALAVNIAPRHPLGLVLANPITAAAGTFGYGTEYARQFDIQQIGAIFSKGTTLRPRKGALPPRVGETAAGMINAVGLQNPGVAVVVAEKAPIWAEWRVPVVVNIAGDEVADYVAVARTLEGVAGVAGLELNISCPNVQAGGLLFGSDERMAADVTAAVRRATSLPLIVKLTPNVTDLRPIARAVTDAGADALTVANTYVGMSIDLRTRRPFLGNRTGGVSGPAIKPLTLRLVYQIAQMDLPIPIIAAGGILTAEDVVEYIMAGATAVQVGTASFARPMATGELVRGLSQWLARNGGDTVQSLRGVALG